ncbi:hypothetical protein GCM10007415_29700 [Parapedobacter pyrenivorans]|uniref:YCII-related domain-containing protein n=1 Tax=Parapedobacter pyrenivorans TaxID=1305674 RepID=A0A917HWL4_9SPHI|nr:YciI family protein [Parapedobacter pyrenivorans]GGG92961.1 hypothetical protein GCM10007415_29700 [Parapedobacter pyrenivorans]
MNEFLLIFRRDFTTAADQPSAESLQQHYRAWKEWFENLAAQDRLVGPTKRWDGAGKVVRNAKDVTDGPYADIKESIGGMLIIKANDYDEAAEVAKDCPIFAFGGNVEIRKALS